MGFIDGKVQITLEPLKKYRHTINRELKSNANGHVSRAVQKWAVRYRAFIQERFVTYSRGGGDWPPLKRRKGSILRDTGTLFAALNPVFTGRPGSVQEFVDGGVKVGFGGSAKHPSGNASVADIAGFHHFGKGNVPKRVILVEPTPLLLNDMKLDMLQALAHLRDDLGR